MTRTGLIAVAVAMLLLVIFYGLAPQRTDARTAGTYTLMTSASLSARVIVSDPTLPAGSRDREMTVRDVRGVYSDYSSSRTFISRHSPVTVGGKQYANIRGVLYEIRRGDLFYNTSTAAP